LTLRQYRNNIYTREEVRARVLKATLKGIRVSKNLKVKDVARAIGISVDTLRNYENFKTAPDIETFRKIIQLYDVDYETVALTAEEAVSCKSSCCSR